MDEIAGRARLAELVAARRKSLRLSVVKAAGGAAVSRGTWLRVEAGDPIQAHNYAGVDFILEWEDGSCERVIAGGDPIPLSPDPSPRTPHDKIEEVIEWAETDPDLEEHERQIILAIVKARVNRDGRTRAEVEHGRDDRHSA